ncbi:NAD(P)-binding domain-containing protein [Marinobacter bohaiensis]|uniref:NAD(P)-binding domain-containing protein n=1 Tax=Marinobacter bohaiensis TaxID=2201898 RepID=UPI000DAC1945|nr:NAD(P)-binding domain-containing protein [Marinobacter bohaiensis]
MDYLVAGAGPAGLMEAHRLSAMGKRVSLISPQWGGVMECMGDHYLQSYCSELELPGSPVPLAHFMTEKTLSPRASHYMQYLRHYADSLPVDKITDTVTAVSFDGTHYSCDLQRHGKHALKARHIVAATGIKPKPFRTTCLAGCRTMACLDAYHHFSDPSARPPTETDVVIIGSGNSAFQIALLAMSTGYNAHILARTYPGIYPIETTDRFALRAQSQATVEKIWKSQTERTSPGISFSIYNNLWRSGDDIVFEIDRTDNNVHIAEATMANTAACGTRRLTRSFSRADTLFVTAIGTEPSRPFSIDAHEDDRDPATKRGIYWVGSAADFRSVNTMVSPRYSA